MAPTIAERLAGFAAALRFEALPTDVVESVKLRILDTLGLALAASRADFAPALLSVVVHEQAVTHDMRAPSATAGVPHLGAHRLQPNEIEAMEVFLRRRHDLPDWRRDKTAKQLAQHVRARLGVPEDRQTSDESLLEQLVAEYRSRGR